MKIGRKHSEDCPRNESGHAIIELALVIPLLAMIAIVSLELSFQLNSYEIATQLSRELASLSYRRCVIDDTGATSVKFNPDTCIDTVIAEFVVDSAAFAPGAEFVASLYNISSATGTVQLTSQRLLLQVVQIELVDDPAHLKAELRGPVFAVEAVATRNDSNAVKPEFRV